MNDDKLFLIYEDTYSVENLDEKFLDKKFDVRLYPPYHRYSIIGDLVENIKKPFKVCKILSKNSRYIKVEWYVEFETAEDKLIEMLKFNFKYV
jgi:hypothetical protein